MNTMNPKNPARPRLDLLLLHPAGTEDSGGIALSIGMLELVRGWLERCSLATAFWPETMVNRDGKTLFILRPHPWTREEIVRKRRLVPTAETAVALTLSGGTEPRVAFGMVTGSAPIRTIIDFGLDANSVFEKLPVALDGILQAMDRPPLGKEGAGIFQTEDRTTALSVLLALERVIAFHAGVGRDTPRRLFEPALQCLARDPAHPIARECLMRLAGGVSEIGTEDAKTAATEAIQRWSSLAPLSPNPPFLLAMTRLRAGELEPARAALEETLRRDPLHVPALEHYAIWFAEHGFVDKGVDVLRHAIGRTNHDCNLIDQAGCLLANAGRIDEATPLFRDAISGGGPPTAYSNLARALLARGREGEALEVLKDGMARGTQVPHLDLLAEIAKRDGVTAANARAILRGRISEGSENEEVQQRLTALCFDLDGPAAAMPQAHRLLDLDPSIVNRRFAYQVLLRAKLQGFETRWDATVAAACEGDAATALDFLNEVVQAEPGYGPGHLMLAVALDRLGRPAEALPAIERASACEENDPMILDLHARLLAQSERLPEAAQIHLTAASLAPRDARILRNAAVSLLRAGYPEEGTRLAHSSLALQPDQPDLLEILKDLRPQPKSIRSSITARVRNLLRRRATPK